MRDPNRIDSVIEKLRALWKTQPDMRLGQLLVNVIRPSQPCPQIFGVEDTFTEAKPSRFCTARPGLAANPRQPKLR